jgi:hypothetical protein
LRLLSYQLNGPTDACQPNQLWVENQDFSPFTENPRDQPGASALGQLLHEPHHRGSSLGSVTDNSE